ncbi:MAG: HD-GYP domain-containing protein [Roseburia sp.]
MELTKRDFEQILNIGISLTTEKDSNKLFDTIVESGMEITQCDASTLYLYEDGVLKFKIMKTISQDISRGSHGESIDDIPSVEFREENICAYTAIHRQVVNIPDVYDSDTFDFSGPKRYDAMTGYRTKSMLVIPIENNTGELLGVLQMINAMDQDGNVIAFDPSYEIIIRSLGSLAAIELINLQYLEEIKIQLHSFVEAMATAIDKRTPYNGTHTRKVAEYSLILAKKINEKHEENLAEEFFDDDRLEKLELAALLHDIGKMVIPREIMNRATRLDHDMEKLEKRYQLLRCYYEIDMLRGTISSGEYEQKITFLREEEEFIHRIDTVGFLPDEDYDRVQRLAEHTYVTPEGEEIPYLTERERECLSIRKGTLTDEDRKKMESHVEMTSKILSKVRFNKNYKDVPKWAGEHHEYLNGTGYPNHLREENLEIETRIITISDVYDALTARDRPYKPAIPMEKAFKILHSMVEEGKLEGRLVDWLEEALLESSQGNREEVAANEVKNKG